MKKIALIFCLMTIFFTGCVIDMDQLAVKPNYTGSYQSGYKPKTQTTPSSSAADKKIIIQRTVATYAQSIRAAGIQCNLTPEEVAYCFSQKMYGNIYEGSTIRMRNGDVWRFFINGVCVHQGDCRVIVTSQGTNYPVDLFVDKSGYIMANNPPLRR